MKKYQFSMEKILDWRIVNEEAAKRDFSKVRQNLERQIALLKEMNKEKKDLQINAARPNSINTLRQLHLYHNFLEQKIMLQEELVAKINEDLDKKLAVLITAQKERKIMEKLSEKQFENYIYQMKKEEQKELDEMGSLRFQKIGNTGL